MEKKLIDDLQKFTSKQLSFYEIIYRKYKWSWSIVGLITLIIGFYFLGDFLYYLKLKKWCSLLISIPFLILAIFYIRNKTLVVLNKYYNEKFNLKISDKWDSKTIEQLQLGLFKEEINRLGITNTEKLRIFIDYLEFDKKSNQYKYSFTINCTLLLLGAFLGVIFPNLFGKIDLEHLNLNYFLLPLLILFVLFYFELIFLKEFIVLRKNKNKRLIKIIYHYFLDESKK